MIETVTKSQDELFCSNCHSKLPKELTQINEKGENIIFCPYCGTQITLKNKDDDSKTNKTPLELSTETKETKDVKFSLTNKEIRHIIRIFIYRNIYQLIKQKKSIMRRLISQKDLSKSQISYLTSKMRNTLLNTSNPVQGAPQELTNPVIRKLNTFYKKFTSSLNDKKAFRERNSQLLAENIQFIYNLIRGDYTFEGLSQTKRTTVLDLKEFFGFKEEKQSKKSVNYNVSLFLAIKIYSIIKQNKSVHLNKSAIDEIINAITEFVIHNDFRNEFFNTLEIYQKRNVARFLKKFEFKITYDWVYRTSFQDHVFKLIYLVNQLFHEKDYWSNLTGSNKLIAEGLQESSLFQDDYEFTAYFRLNLTIILCRIIHKILQDSPDLPQDISNHPNLNPSLMQELLEDLLKEITAQKNINYEFLEKFYKLSLEEFQANYKKFQSKLASDMIYYHNFRPYLSKLIKMVYVITHSVRKKSHLSKVERVIINDLANYNFRWNPERGTKYYFYSNEKEPEKVENQIDKSGKKDIFTIDIPDDSPLWRARAYIIGFLLADGTIRYNPYELAVTQNRKDKDILYNIKKALGGVINGPDEKNKYRLNIYSKNIVLAVKKYGMVKAHSKREIAEKLIPPYFIMKFLNNQSLVRDFIRGFYDGDGWITGSYKRGDTSFRIIGPSKFLNTLKKMIQKEIPEISSFITSEKKQYYLIGGKKYQIFSKLTVYKKGKGYYKLTSEDLKKGEIKTIKHPWLKLLIVGGNYNCTRFFNWLYEDNDNFDTFKVNGIKICGRRKFQKSLLILGSKEQRKEKLAPDWKDFLFEVIISLKSKFYTAKEIMKITNDELKKDLISLKLGHLFGSQKAINLDKFRDRLKYFEFLENLISHYRLSNRKYYYSTINSHPKIPSGGERYIDLIDKNGIKKNIKNYIVYFFMLEDRKLSFNEVKEALLNSSFFNKNSLFLKNIKLNIAELTAFDILINLKYRVNITRQEFILNHSKLVEYYKKNTNEIITELNKLFKKNKK